MSRSPFRFIVTEDENVPTLVRYDEEPRQTTAASRSFGASAPAHETSHLNRSIQSTAASAPVTQVIYPPITLGVLPTTVTSPPTITGVVASAPVAGAVGFQPNTGNIGSGQIPVANNSTDAVAVASGQMPQYVDTDIPVAVQISPTPATAATTTPVSIVGAIEPSTVALTTPSAYAIGGNN